MSKRHREDMDARILTSCSYQLQLLHGTMAKVLRDKGFDDMQILCVWDKTHACLRRIVLALDKENHTTQTMAMKFFVIQSTKLDDVGLAKLVTSICMTCFSLACKIILQHGFRCSTLRGIARVCAAGNSACVSIDGECALSLKQCEIYILELVGWSCGAGNMPGLADMLEADFDCDLNLIVDRPSSMAFRIFEQAVIMSCDSSQGHAVSVISLACMYCIAQGMGGQCRPGRDADAIAEVVDLRLVRALQRASLKCAS